MQPIANHKPPAGNSKGFTLVELSIVLVIIGIILVAILKGQDLIDNARAKKFASTLNTWNALVLAYVDRYGRLPGDFGKNGLIGDQIIGVPFSEQSTNFSTIGEMAAIGVLSHVPENPVTIGSIRFWIYFGYDSTNTNKNVMVICKDANCTSLFTADELKLIQAFDTTVDGSTDAGIGQLRAATDVTLVPLAEVSNRANAVVTAVTGANETTAGLSTAWATISGTTWSTIYRSAVWMFDRPY